MAGGGWRVREFQWDANNSEHVSQHGVEESEVAEMFRGRLYVRRAHGRYLVLGSTATGRRLFAVVERQRARGVRPITARDMTESERRLFARRAR